MSLNPIIPTDDELLPEPDEVTVTDEDLLPAEFNDVPDPAADEEDIPTAPGIEDVDDIPDVPGGDFFNRRGTTDVVR
jgi:hypothetical protein